MTEANPARELACEANAAMIHALIKKRHQTRKEDVERRLQAKESQSVAGEKSDCFFRTFNAERAAIEELVSSCAGADRAAVTRGLEEATSETLRLQKFLNDSMLFLTQYDLRTAQGALQKLQASVAEAREECLPKKKFAFRARAKAADKFARTPSPAAAAATAVDAVSAGVGGAAAPEQCGFSGMANVSLTKTAEEIRKRDVLLTHLTNCKVRLLGSPSTLHMTHIDGCEILCGPVSSSVFVDRCTNSTLVLPCQQLRTHNTTDTRVYLHVTSRAIIEDCRGVGFAPFSWTYPTLEEDFVASGLDRDRNNWSQVDDFNWLAAGTPSPNWTVIPEAERETKWDP